MNYKVLYLINGLGLGNFSRSLPILEGLKRYNYQVDIGCSKRIQELFKKHDNSYCFHEIIQHEIKSSSINQRIKTIIYNYKKIRQVISDYDYNLIITDSIYECYLITKKIPIVSINHIPYCFREITIKNLLNSSINSTFLEILDFFIAKTLPSLTLASFFGEPKPHNSRNVKYINPIIRKDFFLTSDFHNKKKFKVVFMPSGGNYEYTLKAEKLLQRYFYNNSLVIGGSNKLEGLVYLEANANNYRYLLNSERIISNTGIMSTTELLFLGKPFLAIPLPGHLEQQINSNFLKKVDYGVICSYDDIETGFEKFIKISKKENQRKLQFNGAEQAISEIIKILKKYDLHR